ncbi:MAG: GHKL domain-containing protein [Deltaproteobacteria bacterium]|nr:GHKL domain-containing protein [Deltaproteobacteria bacterium]
MQKSNIRHGGNTPFKLAAFVCVLLVLGAVWSFYNGAWISGAVFVVALVCALNLLNASEKKEAENKKLLGEIERSKKEWETTFDSIADLISIHDAQSGTIKVNLALAEKKNVRPQDLIGKSCSEIYYGRDAASGKCMVAKTIESCSAMEADVDDMVFDGVYRVTTFPFKLKIAGNDVPACVFIARDITREKFLRDQLVQSERLSTVGKLVAGIAHEINNPLMGIMGFSQILMDAPGDKTISEVREKLGKIYNESLRTAKIVSNLLSFARSKRAEREYQNINDIIRKALELRVYSLSANNVEVGLNLDLGLPMTMLDAQQMQQIFINLISNAEDAIVSAKKEGRIEITTRTRKRKIEISVKDNGPGIPQDVINKAFDPFFTTKAVGKGAGLGLSMAHGIITEHGGSISLSAPPEGGALVTIELPVVEKEQWLEVKKAVEGAK